MFIERLPKPSGSRRWLYVPYDQLSDRIGPLSREPARELGVVLVESPWKAAQRPYHQQKLLTVLASQRHFALEQAARGVAGRYLVHDGPYADALRTVLPFTGELRVMRPAERELRADLAGLTGLREIPHEGWTSTRADFDATQPARPWRMDRFYRARRVALDLLMDGGKPRGGRWSFDAENRKAWRGSPPVPTRPVYRDDSIKSEVADLIRARYASHPGELHPETLPAAAADVDHYWRWVQRECLPLFGPFEDAMHSTQRHLFHTMLSPLLNLHRLLPLDVARAAAALPLPLASQEGFIRQIIGWREYVHHVHEATDGLRHAEVPPGAPLPAAYWGTPSGLHCLDRVVRDVWTDGYSHHISRLMVLCNLAQLLDVSPREISDWFWVAYVDAYDWVVEPNVLGMGMFAFDDLMTTKPYVSGAAYIHRMSDYCGGCRFDPKRDCPVTPMYWAYLARHAGTLSERMAQPLAALRARGAEKRAQDAAEFERVRSILGEGRAVSPER